MITDTLDILIAIIVKHIYLDLATPLVRIMVIVMLKARFEVEMRITLVCQLFDR